MIPMLELREHEWTCSCRAANVHATSCVRCLRCGAACPNPVTLGQAAIALQTYDAALEQGNISRTEAMRLALEGDRNRRIAQHE